MTWEERVRQLEDEGLTRSDAQAVVDAEDQRQVRTEFGAKRTVCECKVCSTNCRYMPGYLIPADLDRMIPKNVDPKVWAESNLLASPGALVMKDSRLLRIPTLVPAVKPDGSCIHLMPDNRCDIHAIAPFGCAFFDCRPTNRSVETLNQWGIKSVYDHIFIEGYDPLYRRLWIHLFEKNLRQKPAEILREKMMEELG